MDQPDSDDQPVPAKKIRKSCMIHCSDDNSKLVSPVSLKSWKTLLDAAEIRHHVGILEIAQGLPVTELPEQPVYYHRKCRSLFTMRSALDSLKSKNKDKERMASSAESRKSSRGKPGTSTVNENQICIFCNKKTHYKPKSRTKDKLRVCQELRACETLGKAARAKLDTRMISILSRELIAAEGRYHDLCYRDYTREVTTSSCKAGNSALNEDDEAYNKAEEQGFQELYSYLRNDLIPHPDIVPMTTLVSYLESSLKTLGIDRLNQSTRKHLRRKLEAEFGDSIHIIPNSNGRLLLFPDSLSKEELAQSVYRLKQELKDVQTSQSSDIIAKTGLQLRNEIRQHEFKQSWPPNVDEKFEIPTSLAQFLYTLLTGDIKDPQPEARVQRLIYSFGSDLIYAISLGKVKPPKHILLPFSVKTLTGNVELIKMINRLGYGVSYSQLEEIDTALCLQKLALAGDGVALPHNIFPHIFSTVGWDNIDRLEETITGEGTSHRVNGIIIQPKVEGPTSDMTVVAIPKLKQRSISASTPLVGVYNAGKRVGPSSVETIEVEAATQVREAKVKNYVWLLARLFNTNIQTVSGWTGFNILIRDNIEVIQDTIGYLPTINAPATDMSTIHEILTQSLLIKQSLGLEKLVCVFDQAIFAKAAELVWKHEEFKDLIIRMGDFHLIGNMLSTIGKRFQDAGLRDLCVEAGVVAEGSITGVIEGRQYNPGVRTHKLVYEALMRLAWKQFIGWLELQHKDMMESLNDLFSSVEEFHCNITHETFEKLKENNQLDILLDQFISYTDIIRNQHQLSAYWISYIDMVEILLGLLRASREGDWLLHLAMVRKTIAWCFAYDKVNYARFLPYYYTTMSRLQLDHPEVYDEFLKGAFTVQIGERNPFGRIPVDQTVEETVNKNTQTPGGTKGFSLKSGAVKRYYLNAEFRSHYLCKMREMISQSGSKMAHPDLQPTRIQIDEDHINSLVDLLENSWINPFDPDQVKFVNIASGKVVPPEIAKDLLEAEAKGEAAYITFKEKCIEGDLSQELFYSRLSKLKLKTFSDMQKKDRTAGSAKAVVLNADRKLFAHMILIAETRQLNMKEVLSHPLGPLPWSLAGGDGTIRKTDKSTLGKELIKMVDPVEVMPEVKSTIIDGMAMIQKFKGNDRTFEELASSVLNQILHEGSRSQRIDVVFDTYPNISIKNLERQKRGEGSGIHFSSIAPGHNIQQWRKLLRCGSSKTSLIKFFVAEWQKNPTRAKLNDTTLYVTCEEKCYRITSTQSETVADLPSSQEEADSRILLHALHAAQSGFHNVVISSDDTDVMVIALAASSSIPCNIFLKYGKKNRTQYIDINKLYDSLGPGVSDAIVGMHAFTGCDTVSAFSGRGKVTAFNQLKSNETYQAAYSEIGKSATVSDNLFEKLQEITCTMYQKTTPTISVNALRYQLFCAKRGECESSSLPPCQDTLWMHAQRANYQAAIWRRCLECNPQLPNPTECGWVMENGNLAINWMQVSPAPQAVLQLLACKCSRSCKDTECPCMINGLTCTDMCKLQTCGNQRKEDETDMDLSDLLECDDGDDE